jgi:hypothetical protein
MAVCLIQQTLGPPGSVVGARADSIVAHIFLYGARSCLLALLVICP